MFYNFCLLVYWVIVYLWHISVSLYVKDRSGETILAISDVVDLSLGLWKSYFVINLFMYSPYSPCHSTLPPLLPVLLSQSPSPLHPFPHPQRRGSPPPMGTPTLTHYIAAELSTFPPLRPDKVAQLGERDQVALAWHWHFENSHLRPHTQF